MFSKSCWPAETAADDNVSVSDEHFAQNQRRTESATPAGQNWVYEMDYIAAVDQPHELTDAHLTAVLSTARESGLSDFLVGFPAAPFILVLRAENPANFAHYVDDHNGADVMVHIGFDKPGQIGSDLVIVPADGSERFRLQFTLPDLLADWLLDGKGVPAQRALDMKGRLLSSITVFRGNRLVRLLYKPNRRRNRH